MNKIIGQYIAVSSAMIILWVALIYFPAQSKLTNIAQKSQLMSDELGDYKRTIEKLPEYLETYKNLDSLKKRLNEKLYTKHDVLKLFERMEKLAYANNLYLTEITPPVSELLYLNKIVADSTKSLNLNITIRLIGGYKDFGKFSMLLEKEDFFQKLNNCQVIGSRQKDFQLSHLISFKAILGTNG